MEGGANSNYCRSFIGNAIVFVRYLDFTWLQLTSLGSTLMLERSRQMLFFKRHFPLAMFLLTWLFRLGKKPKLIFGGHSSLQEIRVIDEGSIRSLQLGVGNTPIQACISLKNPSYLALSCNRLMLAALYLNPQPHKILILGLGGGVLPRTLGRLLPKSDITSVENDPLVAKVAQTYFGFHTSTQQHLIIDDGRKFITLAAAQGKQYDLIMLDAYDAHYIPTELMTMEFLQLVKSLLAPQGILAANTFSLSRLYERESATYSAIFGHFYNLQYGNRIILTKKGELPEFNAIRQNAQSIAPQFKSLGINTRWLTNLFTLSQDPPPLTAPLQDEYDLDLLSLQ